MVPRTKDFFVPRTAHYQATNWKFIPARAKVTLAMGRTCPNVGSLVTQEKVDELVEQYGTHRDSSRTLSIVQQLDMIATQILIVDRRYNVSHAHSERKDYLSPNQLWVRMKKEIPFPNIEAVIAIRADPSKRARQYAERIVDVPYNKLGDRYRVWSQPAQKVGRDD